MPTSDQPPPDLGRRIREYFSSVDSYQLLDAYPPTDGCTWTSGGCALAARALLMALPTAELCEVVDADDPDHCAQHFLVRYEGAYLDADGLSTELELLERWSTLERLGDPQVSPSSLERILDSGIPSGVHPTTGLDHATLVAAQLRAVLIPKAQ